MDREPTDRTVKRLISFALLGLGAFGFVWFLSGHDTPDRSPSASSEKGPEHTRTLPRRAGAAVANHRGGSVTAAKRGPKRQKAHVAADAYRRIHDLLACREHTAKGCPQVQEDPRAGYFLLSRTILEAADAILSDALSGRVDPGRLKELSLALLRDSDSAVQCKAMEMIALLPPDRTIFSELIGKLETTYDTQLASMALMELRRYGPQMGSAVPVLARTIAHGSPRVARRLGKEILPILNRENVETFEKLARSLPVGSKRREYLEMNLLEFKRRSTGG